MYLGVKDRTSVTGLFFGPLNSRAWVRQEHLFSRRTIHFASEQIYWECDKHLLADDNEAATDPSLGPLGIGFMPTRSMLCYNLACYLGKTQLPLPEAVAADENPFGTIADLHTIWGQNVVFFSRCGLTRASYKLPALYSLAKKLQDVTGHAYHEGHWFDGSNFALAGLLWHAAPRKILKKEHSDRAPSWSWASLEGPLAYLDFKNWWCDVWHPQRWDMKILGVNTFKPLNIPSVKALMLGAAQIPCSRCQCIETTVSSAERLDVSTALKMAQVVSERGELIQGSFEFDLEKDQPSQFWLLPMYVRFIAEKRPVWFVLVVSEVLKQKKDRFVFRRVGCGWVDHPL